MNLNVCSLFQLQLLIQLNLSYCSSYEIWGGDSGNVMYRLNTFNLLCNSRAKTVRLTTPLSGVKGLYIGLQTKVWIGTRT